MKHSLNTSGLSMTQAQSISNLMNQRAADITQQLDLINNSAKTLNIQGEVFEYQVGHKMPSNVIDLLKEKATLHACQGFIMENIKFKDKLLLTLKKMEFEYKGVAPAYPKFTYHDSLPSVTEDWAWSQLSVSEYNEYLEQEALAAHLGQFFHKGGKLSELRLELTKVKPLEWVTLNQGTVNSDQRPVKVVIHHAQSELLQVHNELAALHRAHEQRVNYFKSKVKNLVTEENARIARLNGEEQAKHEIANNNLQIAYEGEMRKFNAAKEQANSLFEQERQAQIGSNAALKIQVDPRFQPVVDYYMGLLSVAKAL